MIKLTKLAKPEILELNELAWTDQLMRKREAGEEPTSNEKSRYRHPQIKEVLLMETNAKCAYCESKLLHVTYGDVEHISPKATELEAIFRWDNLTLACDVCNTNKGGKFKNKVGLIDPYSHDPDCHFEFWGPMIMPRPQDYDAMLTEKELDLNRIGLLEQRREKIKYLVAIVGAAIAAPESRRPAMVAALERECDPDQEYSALAKKIISDYLQTCEQG